MIIDLRLEGEGDLGLQRGKVDLKLDGGIRLKSRSNFKDKGAREWERM